MNTPHRFFATLALILCFLTAAAEQVNVTITPKRSVLPPQVMLYIANPGQYFNISVQNPETEAQAIFFGAEVHQLSPTSAIDIVVPARTMPKQGIVVQAGQTRVLDAVQLRTLFNHVRQSDVEMPQGLFENVASGGFGMLEEGTYEIVLNAYKWDPTLSRPVLLSNPTLSRCTFTVCYQASAPKWVSPVSMNDYENHAVATLSQQVPMLQWTSPVVSCNPTPVQYTYDLKIVQAMPMQSPDEAISRNPVVYQKASLTMSQCLIPVTVIRTFSPDVTYVAQITARSNNTQEGTLDFVSLQNNGESDLLQFRVKDYSAVPESQKPEETAPSAEKEKDKVEIFGGMGKYDESDSLYVFKNPEITTPSFALGDGARKKWVKEDIPMEWRKPWFQGGRGTRPDSLRFAYDVQLYAASEYLERQEMLEREPVYTSKRLTEETDTIRWKDIQDKVKVGDYLLVQVSPVALNEQSVQFVDDSVNVADFALANRFSPRYFECSNGLEITNTNPTRLSVKDLQGKTVKIGEYDLVLDGAELKAGKQAGHFSGTGHVIWQPLKFTWKLAVKFDDIAVNTDNEVYEGLVETFEGDKATAIRGSEVVGKLFSDWGIDNLIGDSGIPYASKLQEKIDGKVASLADELGNEIAPYYKAIKEGKAKIEGLLRGNIENVTFPLELPDEINPTPVSLQISSMKFAPTYATMDFFGTFVVPETEATKNQILVFGAPRICISPKSLVPEGTTIALLKDFTVKDPNTDYDCTFKAPKDVITPQDGCYVAWSDGKFTAFKFDVDMTLPNLKKVVGGKATNECPKLHITADIKAPVGEGDTKMAGWDWYGTADLDPFEHADLPGYTFHAADKVYIDHSARENVAGMPGFPKDYDLGKAGLQGADASEWMGVYIGELSMEFPEDIKVGNGGERMKVSLSNMFIDKSGMTVEAGIVNAINYKRGEAGTIGGFAFTMDTISVNFIQNQHKDFGFRGTLQIPLFKGTVHYACNIYNQRFTGRGTGEGYAYVFKTYQMDGLSFDFMLGDLTLEQKLTYLLVEALPDAQGKLNTNVELMLGGKVTIAGAKTANEFIKSKLKSLPFDLSLPEIRFCKMRLANNRGFESVYERQMQEAAIAETAKMDDEGKGWWTEARDIELCSGKLFLNFGQWGYASPQKKIGPFNFSLKKYSVNFSGTALSFVLGGGIEFSDELKISADASISINSELKIPKDKFNFSAYELNYKEVEFSDASLGFEMPGLKLNGTLASVKDNDKGGGYKGNLSLVVGGGLFNVKVDGGYFNYKSPRKSFSYGYFKATAGAKMGIPCGPISLTGLTGGLYFNCVYNPSKEDAPTVGDNTQGAIGVLFGVGLATTDQVTFKGNFEFAVCVMPNGAGKYRLSTLKLDGKMACLEGMIKSNVTLLYQNDDSDRFFQLTATIDASADGAVPDEVKALYNTALSEKDKLSKLSKGFKQSLDGKISELGLGEAADYLAGAMGSPENSFKGAVTDNNDSKTNQDAAEAYEKETEGDKTKKDVKVGEVKASGPSAQVSLDLRIQSKKNGQECSPVLWHVYLGEPDVDKRCKFTLVDFESDIVTVIVGANAYFCLGSELPNNGQLPPLPSEVQEFLDGGVHGAAKSDNIAKANNARRRTLNEIMANQKVNGGVMVGAQVYGKIKVDLGLFAADMGATAGFDISIVKLAGNAQCVNLHGRPGYNGWYGSGQLYAYLYAKLNFRVNLGFFKKDIPIAKAGFGGVLEAKMPNPNYFRGKCRAEIQLLDGLVHINKTFQFTCGDYCQLFLGNALDDYKLFGDINVGYDNLGEAYEKKVATDLSMKPTVTTQATIGKVTRVVDPTEEDRITNSGRNEGAEDFSALASRSFRFILPDNAAAAPYLQEFNDTVSARRGYNISKAMAYGRPVTRKSVPAKQYLDYTVSGEQIILDLSSLNPGKVYRIMMTGAAQEFRSGRWMDPETWNEKRGRYEEMPWQQTKTYYIVTEGADDEAAGQEDAADLEPNVKLAYPMAGESMEEGRIVVRGKKKVNAEAVDIVRPMVSLGRKMKGNAYTNGRLTWVLYRDIFDCETAKDGKAQDADRIVDYETTDAAECKSRQKQRVDNLWIENDSVSILTPKTAFSMGKSLSGDYTIRLLYQWEETDNKQGWTKVGTPTVVYGTAAAATAYAATQKKYSGSRYRVTILPALNGEAGASSVGRRGSATRTRTSSAHGSSAARNSGNDNTKYTITVMQKTNISQTRHLTKVLVNLPVHAASSATYDDAFCGVRLTSFELANGQGTRALAGFRQLAATDKTLLGGDAMSGINHALTADPIAYLDYMGTLGFMGGFHMKSHSSYYNLDVTTTESMTMQTPFDINAYQVGVLQVPGSQHASQLKDAYPDLVRQYIPGHWMRDNEQAPYMLKFTGDDRVGAEGPGIRPWAATDVKDFVRIYLNLCMISERLSNDLNTTLTNAYRNKWHANKDKKWREWLANNKYGVKTFAEDAGHAGQEFTLKVPVYQYALMHMGREDYLEGNMKAKQYKVTISRQVHSSRQGTQWHNDNYFTTDTAEVERYRRQAEAAGYRFSVSVTERQVGKLDDDGHFRFQKKWGKALYAAAAWSLTDVDYSNSYSAKFDARKAKDAVRRILYQTYRVNAWNFKQKRWTVYTGECATEANRQFFVSSALSVNTGTWSQASQR